MHRSEKYVSQKLIEPKEETDNPQSQLEILLFLSQTDRINNETENL